MKVNDHAVVRKRKKVLKTEEFRLMLAIKLTMRARKRLRVISISESQLL
jgi:hypothetical protein